MSAAGSEVWRPTAEQIEAANVTRLMQAHGIERFDELVRRSISDPVWFWDAVVHDLDLEFSTPVPRGRGPFARPGVGDLVRRWPNERRAPMRRSVGRAHSDRPGGRVGRGGR